MTLQQHSEPVLQPIPTQKTADTVVERLEAHIFNGTFAVGDLLPSEEQLAAQLGVGRRSVREALKVLEARGLVEVKMGVGTTVKRNDFDSFLDALARNITTYVRIDKADVDHVAELRTLLETAALERLASSTNDEFLTRLCDIVTNQKSAQAARDYQRYQDWHVSFHTEIIDSLDNPLISMLYRKVLALMRIPMERAESDPTIMASSIDDHEQIVDALRHRSADRLGQIMRSHLQTSMTNIKNAIEYGAE